VTARSLSAVACALLLAVFAGAAEAEKKPTPKPKRPVVLIKTSHGEVYAELFADEAPETVANFTGLAEGKKEFTDAKSGEKVKRPFYDGLKFHRVIKNFMIQGGCPKGDGTGGPGYAFKDEINATALGLDKLKAVDAKTGAPNKSLLIRTRQDFTRTLLAPLIRAMGITKQEQLKARMEEVKKKMTELTIKGAYENLGYKYNEKLSSHHPRKGVLAMANSGPNTNGSQFFINLADTPWLAGKHTVFGKVIKGISVIEKIGEVEVGERAVPVKPVTITSIRPVARPEGLDPAPAAKRPAPEEKKPAPPAAK
jgi:peptidyl-prolyl cis-trans isomerase A (cyclophilin A)